MSKQWEVCPKRGLVRVRLLGSTITCNALLVPQLRAFASMALYTRYGKWLMEQSGAVQCYACRQARGSSGHSEHAHGTALDVRPGSNPMTTPIGGRRRPILVTDMARFGVGDGVAFVNAAKRAGFRWGADWTTDLRLTGKVLARNGRENVYVNRVSDAMHLESALTPGDLRSPATQRELDWLWKTANGRKPYPKEA